MSQTLRRRVFEARVSGVGPYLILLPFHSPATVEGGGWGMEAGFDLGGLWQTPSPCPSQLHLNVVSGLKVHKPSDLQRPAMTTHIVY